MTATFTIPVTIRRPFEVIKLPLLGKLYRGWGDQNNPKFIRKASRSAFKFFYKLGIGGKGDFQINSGKFVRFDVRNTQFHSVYGKHKGDIYEPEVSWLVDTLVPDNGVFYDVGSNFGYFSLFLSSRNNFCGRIFAFEANPQVFRDMESCVVQAGYSDRIKLFNLAVADRNGVLDFTVPDGMQSGYGQVSQPGAKHGFQVKAGRLDDLGLPAPDVIKIDVEGLEDEVVCSAKGLIRETSPYIIFESWTGPEKKESAVRTLVLLRDACYSFYYPLITADGNRLRLTLTQFGSHQRGSFPDGVNFLAVPDKKMDEFIGTFNTYEKNKN